MNDPFQIQRELRYGAPVCDQIMTGRYFSIGYSWYFRQAKWALEIVRRDRDLVNDGEAIQRLDNFRADTRVPARFRASLNAYKGSGYDRGHLAASANHDLILIQNSETFLLSNMSPQHEDLNRRKWRELEEATRELDARPDIYEVYVLTCPIFYFERAIEVIGKDHEEYGISIPVPHAFVKSVLAEDDKGRLSLWTFLMSNEAQTGQLSDYLVKTYDAEQLVGGRFWDRIAGGDLHEDKGNIRPMWTAA
ncbi:MAG: DNA/RNA endonuclease G [Sphingomonadales bacterium 32-68-7]|nr:MAG: DNA/RNA endonuclease G [Sphingomonadales bacterium 12-68-11]OYX08702.1 MAG: DNA/RNA endonuclease G [Sphingomonadales bacterium 32-68-7]